MFLRFSISERHECSHQMAGVFVAAYRLRNSGLLPEHEHDYLLDILDWFNIHLPRPRRFSVTGLGQDRAICWFRSSANACVSRAWEMATIL